MAIDAFACLFPEELYHFSPPVVVVTGKPWRTYSADAHALLARILTSVKIDIGAACIVSQTSLNFDALTSFAGAKVLAFGTASTEKIPLYSQTTAHGFTVICADDLEEFNDDKKKNLWTALRQMFGV